jgi:hypothetical protein
VEGFYRRHHFFFKNNFGGCLRWEEITSQADNRFLKEVGWLFVFKSKEPVELIASRKQ